MMKRLLYSLLGLVLLGTSLAAQEGKRWTLGLSLEYGRLSQYKEYNKGEGCAIVPSICYNLNKNLGIGLGVLLPISSTEDPMKGLHYTTGGELAVTGSIELVRKFRLSLSAIGLLGITGNYKAHERPFLELAGNKLSSHNSGDTRSSIHYEHWRWAVGLRPKISYQFSSAWGIELGAGFWGYRSQRDLLEGSYYFLESEKRIKGAWGFNDELGWGSAWRLGITYSF